MKYILPLFSAIALSVMVSCSDPKDDALDTLRYLYEELSANSEYYTQDEWVAILENYAVNDSIISSYEYTPEEQQEINDLRGRCAAYFLKGAEKGARSELEKTVKGIGDFTRGLLDELDNSSK